MPKLVRAPKRVFRSPVADSRRWDRFRPRENDIIIATFAKCGTTWMQRIVDLLVFQSPDVRPFGDLSPWLDATIFDPLEEVLATLEAQRRRRYIKSHLPFDALPVWEGVKYIHVGRDGRDARLSWQNHLQGFRPEFAQRIAAQARALAGAGAAAAPASPPPAAADPHGFLVQWFDELEAALDGPGGAESTFFGFEATFWRERTLPHLLLVHYDDLQADLAAEMARISDFLGIGTPAALMPSLVEAACFDAMKKDGDALYPGLAQVFDRGADRFLNQGRSGRWREYATAEDVARYQAIVRRAAGPGLARWLEGGRRGAGEPRASPD